MKSSKAKAIWLAVLSVSLLAWTAAYAQITPRADSHTNTATPTANYGAKTLLDVDSASQITCIPFNLASIPSGAGRSNGRAIRA